MAKKRNEPPDEDSERPRMRRRRDVTPEEAVLWSLVASSIEPLRRSRRAAAQTEPIAGPRSIGPRAVEQPTRPRHDVKAVAPPPRRSEPKLVQPFEPKRAKRLTKGKLAIEARLDLHGMRQGEAHVALVRFVLDAHVRGLRHVKVITGKGAPEGQESDRTEIWERREDRGVLRRMVPIWLAEAQLSALVVSFTAAGRGHGGDGALYVQVRRKERGKG